MIQSPSQLRALYGPDVTEDILTNCGLEIVFAPKELKVAQELSERLGYYTYRARSRSRPMGLGQGRRSLTDSDQKRALMLPQELMQLSSKALIVLKAGLAPTRGRKLVYYRDRRFTGRLRPPPEIKSRAAAPRASSVRQPPPPSPEPEADMDFDSIVRRFAREGLTPPPPGATEGEVQAWLDRIVSAPSTVSGRVAPAVTQTPPPSSPANRLGPQSSAGPRPPISRQGRCALPNPRQIPDRAGPTGPPPNATTGTTRQPSRPSGTTAGR